MSVENIYQVSQPTNEKIDSFSLGKTAKELIKHPSLIPGVLGSGWLIYLSGTSIYFRLEGHIKKFSFDHTERDFNQALLFALSQFGTQYAEQVLKILGRERWGIKKEFPKITLQDKINIFTEKPTEDLRRLAETKKICFLASPTLPLLKLGQEPSSVISPLSNVALPPATQKELERRTSALEAVIQEFSDPRRRQQTNSEVLRIKVLETIRTIWRKPVDYLDRVSLLPFEKESFLHLLSLESICEASGEVLEKIGLTCHTALSRYLDILERQPRKKDYPEEITLSEAVSLAKELVSICFRQHAVSKELRYLPEELRQRTTSLITKTRTRKNQAELSLLASIFTLPVSFKNLPVNLSRAVGINPIDYKPTEIIEIEKRTSCLVLRLQLPENPVHGFYLEREIDQGACLLALRFGALPEVTVLEIIGPEVHFSIPLGEFYESRLLQNKNYWYKQELSSLETRSLPLTQAHQ